MTEVKESKTKKLKAAAPTEYTGARPIDETKVLKLIHGMVPDSRKAANLQDAVMFLLAEVDRMSRAAAAPAAGKDSEVLEWVKKTYASLDNVKQQISVMRQYGIGATK